MRALWLGAGLLLAACTNPGEAPGPLVLGGVEVSAETLAEGQAVYLRTCAPCHGDDGDGRGPAAPSLSVPPRDFRQGTFKYAGVRAGELPNDEDLVRTVRRGLPGTPMLPWDLTERERRAVVQYLKTFSPRWRTEAPPPPLRPPPDPWASRPGEAVERGEAVYHVTARCFACHGAYATRARIGRLATALGVPAPALPDDLDLREAQASEFFAGTEPVRIVPPDFLEDRMKNGTSLTELYRTIAAGVGGTAMPTWQGSMPDEDLWALVHYTKSLVDRRAR